MKPITNSAELNEFAQRVHKANEHWWQDVHTQKPIERNRFELLALSIGEVAEALEGERKDRMDDHLPHRKNAEVEMADAYIRLCDFAVGFGLKLEKGPQHKDMAQNKGAALFHLMRLITYIGGDEPGFWTCISLVYIEQYCEKHGYDLWGAIEEKLAFNAVRPDHKHEARRIAGGKQF